MYWNDLLKFLLYTSIVGGGKNTIISVDRSNKNNMEYYGYYISFQNHTIKMEGKVKVN
jgi:azurin